VSGRVVLVGAGPGDPDLLTVRAAREIAGAEVLMYDALIDPALLELAPEGCERIDVGKRGDGTRGFPQDRIAGLMIERARAGRRVVRLKGGDPFVFGRGGEEASALAAAGVAFEVVPGISSALAVPAYAGIPVTDRRLSSSVAVVTGHRGKQVEDARIDWEGLARSAETLVVLMGTAWLGDIVERIVRGGRDPRTPAAAIAHGTTPQQRVVSAALEELPACVREAGLGPPTVIVVGEVTRFRDALAWFEKRPLFGRRVLVTRPREAARATAQGLRRRGAAAVCVPLIAFEPPLDPGPLERALGSLGEWDWLVFTSATAVRETAQRMRALGAGALPSSLRVACVGPATAAAARALGLPVHVEPEERSLPAELAAALVRVGLAAGARVLFPAAERAREELPAALDRAGARTSAVAAYRTVLPADAAPALRKAVGEGIDAVLLASPSAVEHLARILGEPGLLELAGRAVLACIGPTTARALGERGIEPAVVSARQTGEDLIEALARHFAEARHGVP
jgi:uroporphyrinogen III methyltransferase/synthase